MARLCALLNKAFTAPSSPVSGLAGYSLEGGAKHLHPASLAAVLRAKPKKLTSLVPLVEKADKRYDQFIEWFWKELAQTIKASKKAKKTDLSQLKKGDLPGHEFHGNQWTGGLGAKPTSQGDLKSTEKSAMLKELLASGHPFTAGEIANITGASSTYVNKTLKAMEGKDTNGLTLAKVGSKYVVQSTDHYNKGQAKAFADVNAALNATGGTNHPTGEGKTEDHMTTGAKPGAVQETKPSEAKATTSETHKAIPPASPMTKAAADKVYATSLQEATFKAAQDLKGGDHAESVMKEWKESKALAMAQWKANTTGVGMQSKPQAVFKSDIKFAEALKGVTTQAQQDAAYAQWKKDTAAEKSGAAVGIKEAAKDAIGKMDTKAEPELPVSHSSLVPASHKAITKGDFVKSTGAVNGKWARGMSRVKSLLAKDSDSASGNKAQIEKQLGERLKDSGSFQKVSAMYDKIGGHGTSTKTLQAALISKWAGTSADSDSLAQAMQMVTRDVFGMDHSDVNEIGNAKLPSSSSDVDKLYSLAGKQLLGAAYDHSTQGPVVQAALKDFIKAQYSNTQEYFKAAGVKELYLVRGMKVGSSSATAHLIGLKLQPASSFSANLGTARSFAGQHTLYLVKVPVSQVLGTYRTGYGCTNEHEVVVLADKNTTAVKVGKSVAGSTLGDVAKNVAKDLL